MSTRGCAPLPIARRNWGKNVTLLASMGWEGMGPCVAVEGATTGAVFESARDASGFFRHCGYRAPAQLL